MSKNKITVFLNDFLTAQQNYEGWCSNCNAFTRDCTEPDAEHYDCPECEDNTVYGADYALILELFEVKDEEY